MKITPTALSTSDQYLRILVSVEIAHGQRIHVIRIPWEWLIEEQILDSLDRVSRRALIAAWSDAPLDDPLW